MVFDPVGWMRWSLTVHWKDYVDVAGVIGTVAAAIAAGLAVRAATKIADRQEELTRRQLKQTLFEKRFESYYTFRQFVEHLLVNPPDPSFLPKLARELEQARFLFDENVWAYLNRLSDAARAFMNVRYRLEGIQFDRGAQAEEEALRKLQNQAMGIFSAYLKLDKN